LGENRWGEQRMEAYEFYWLDPKGGYQIIGVLPERRKNSVRVTKESIMRWGENIFGKDFDTKDIFFIQVTIDEKTVRIFRPVPITITQKDV
jgi:hypothetical protein